MTTRTGDVGDTDRVDAVVVGSGPNGLTAAAVMARAGVSVAVYEAASTVGGGARTQELTLPGFRHDVCSAVHPLAAGSPVFRTLPLGDHGLGWVQPPTPLAHPFPDGSAASLERSPAATAATLGADGTAYRQLVAPFLGRWDALADDVLRPVLAGWPASAVLLARFGLRALAPAAVLARVLFRGRRARGLLAGMAAHAMAPLGSPGTAGIGLMFALAGHAVGWPLPRGGSQAIADALARYLGSLGVGVHTGDPIRSLADLPPARAYLLDVMPEQAASLAGDRLPEGFGRRLRCYRHGPAAFKVDYALSGPVPWTAEAARNAGSVHVGPTLEDIEAALRAAQRGTPPRHPFLVAAQPSLFDDTRAPAGQHVLWAYTHVPNGWRGDATAAIEDQIERLAPGFRDLVLARQVTAPADLAAANPNNVGGDIAGGRCDRLRLLLRPRLAVHPYATPDPSVYLCSSATPPGPGVHGMCGYHAARLALRRVFDREVGTEWTGGTHPTTG